MIEEFKNRIDNMSYESMLALWRNAPIGHPMFEGEVGDYYKKVMAERREELVLEIIKNSRSSAPLDVKIDVV